MISGSKCRHLNNAGRGLLMEYTAGYQTRSQSFCNTAKSYAFVLATLVLTLTPVASIGQTSSDGPETVVVHNGPVALHAMLIHTAPDHSPASCSITAAAAPVNNWNA
jgi:hypothetical protein